MLSNGAGAVHVTSRDSRSLPQNHNDIPNQTFFDGSTITVPSDRVTFVVRKDALFATNQTRLAYLENAPDMKKVRSRIVNPDALQMGEAIRKAYQKWGDAVIAAIIDNYDYSKFGFTHRAAGQAFVHFHNTPVLTKAVIQRAAAEIGERRAPLYLSLDDLISKDLFRESGAKGNFGEFGFSRLFSLEGEQKDYVARPGKPSFDQQVASISRVANFTNTLGWTRKTPLILLEDNVRRAKMVLWAMERLQENGLYKWAEPCAIATCFAVASEEERAKIVYNDKTLPMVVGYDYKGGPVDVLTTRDHLFDGLVVDLGQGRTGRLPSFMLPDEKIPALFSIHPKKGMQFKERVLLASIDFCVEIQKAFGSLPSLACFTTGRTMAEVEKVELSRPMTQILQKHLPRRGLFSFTR